MFELYRVQMTTRLDMRPINSVSNKKGEFLKCVYISSRHPFVFLNITHREILRRFCNILETRGDETFAFEAGKADTFYLLKGLGLASFATYVVIELSRA